MNIKFKIVNVVATATLDQPICLKHLAELFPSIVLYDPAAYPPPVPAYFKLKDMEGKVSVFSSGRMISVGTKSEKKAHKELYLVAKKLEMVKIARMKTTPRIENIVATADLGNEQDLGKISETTGALYEPDQFPGAIIRLSSPEKDVKATVLLFASGKLVCVGVRKKEDLSTVVQKYLKEIILARAS
jgi:transcription initiation factor TFIID TATA-box-binding protein